MARLRPGRPGCKIAQGRTVPRPSTSCMGWRRPCTRSPPRRRHRRCTASGPHDYPAESDRAEPPATPYLDAQGESWRIECAAGGVIKLAQRNDAYTTHNYLPLDPTRVCRCARATPPRRGWSHKARCSKLCKADVATDHRPVMARLSFWTSGGRQRRRRAGHSTNLQRCAPRRLRTFARTPAWQN